MASWEIMSNFAPLKVRGLTLPTAQCAGSSTESIKNNIKKRNIFKMIIVQVKEGDNIEKALKKFKRKFEKTGIVKELRSRQAFQKPSVTNRKKMMKAVYVQKLRLVED